MDCDVLQADGGTRTASITGAMVALDDAFENMLAAGLITRIPIKHMLAAISVGVVRGEVCLDLCYEQDSQAEVDFNVVMTEQGEFIEVQGTAEQAPFSPAQLNEMLETAGAGIQDLIVEMKQSIAQRKLVNV